MSLYTLRQYMDQGYLRLRIRRVKSNFNFSRRGKFFENYTPRFGLIFERDTLYNIAHIYVGKYCIRMYYTCT